MAYYWTNFGLLAEIMPTMCTREQYPFPKGPAYLFIGVKVQEDASKQTSCQSVL